MPTSVETNDVAKLLVAERDVLAGDADFAKEVSDQGEILVRRAEWLAGAGATVLSERTLPASEESFARLFAMAERKLTPEVARAYVRQRLAQDSGVINVARLEAYALAVRDKVMDKLNSWASGRKDALRHRLGPDVAAKTPAQQDRYKTILRQAPEPTLMTMTLPEAAMFAAGEIPFEDHLYADEQGETRIRLGSTWETDAVKDALDGNGVIAWLRNVDRAEWALTLPRWEDNRWKPMYPDILVVREDGQRILVDVVDPHDHTKPDAISKAKGLSRYAALHVEQLGHVDLIAKVDNRYRRLHLEHGAIREKVDALGSDLASLEALYKAEG